MVLGPFFVGLCAVSLSFFFPLQILPLQRLLHLESRVSQFIEFVLYLPYLSDQLLVVSFVDLTAGFFDPSSLVLLLLREFSEPELKLIRGLFCG